MRFVVHAKAIVNVTLQPIEAPSPKSAIEKAEAMVLEKMAGGLFDDRCPRDSDIKHIESGDDIECFLVDQEGDAEYSHSEWYARDHSVMKPDGCERCNAQQRIGAPMVPGEGEKLYEVTEFYPQAEVRKKITVIARDEESARDDPHSCKIVSAEYDIDEGGEAVTADVQEIKP